MILGGRRARICLIGATLICGVAAPRVTAAAALVALPGMWLTLATPWWRARSFPDRLLFGFLLSPLVLVVQFYLLRLAGVSFPWTCWALVLVNAPAVLLVVRLMPELEITLNRRAAIWLLLLGIPLVTLGPQLIHAVGRAYSGHAWLHADAADAVARGQLILEDADLAGARLAYAWGGHVDQAVVSWIAGAPPFTSFIWTNLVLLGVVFLLVMRTTAKLGGGFLARAGVLAWLSFGVNFVGYAIDQSLSLGHVRRLLGGMAPFMTNAFRFGGDWRFTPWLLYFFFFHQIVFALAIMAGIAYLLCVSAERVRPRGDAAILALLGFTLALVYPLIFPAAAALLAASLLAVWAGQRVGERPLAGTVAFRLLALVAATAATYASIRFFAAARVTSTAGLHPLGEVPRYLLVGAAALLPLWVGFAFWARRASRYRTQNALTFGLSALACTAAYVLFAIPGGGLEYKFVFVAAILLAPFPALVVERSLSAWPRLGEPIVLALSLVLAIPFVHKLATDGWTRAWLPAVGPATYPVLDLSGFHATLASSEPEAPLVQAVMDRTPERALIVTASARLHLPTLTRRAFYVMPDAIRGVYPGVGVSASELLLDIRGYPEAMVRARQQNVADLLGSSASPDARVRALAAMKGLQRPLVVIMRDSADEAALSWLRRQEHQKTVFHDGRTSAILIDGE